MGDEELRMEIERIEVSEDRKRELGSVERLKESIAEVGLLQPIVITKGRMLVAGLHRLEACRQLGWETIAVRIVALDAIRAELAEIDENLVRTELTVLQKSEQLQRRMEIYESLHPTAKKGGTPGAGRGKGNKKRECISDDSSLMQTESFADNTARKLNTSPRQVQRLVQVARLSDDDKKKIKGTPLEDNHDNLLKLVREKDEDRRGKLIDTIVSGEAKNVAEAAEKLDAETLAEEYGEVGRMLLDGVPVGEIAATLNVSPHKVQHVRRRMGIPARREKSTQVANFIAKADEAATVWETACSVAMPIFEAAGKDELLELLAALRRQKGQVSNLIRVVETSMGGK